MIEKLNSVLTPENAAVGGLGAAGVWMLFKRMVLKGAVTDSGIEAAEAQTTVIEMLRAEVLRLSASNKDLSCSLETFHAKNMELKNEVSELKILMNNFASRMASLDRISSECRKCQHYASISSAFRNCRSTDVPEKK